MPTPVATAGRDTRERADTAWQSLIYAQSARRTTPVSMKNRPLGEPGLDVLPGPARLVARWRTIVAISRSSIYHRFSMIRDALITAAGGPAKAFVATPRPFAIVASKRR
jgi:hypothetical protein